MAAGFVAGLALHGIIRFGGNYNISSKIDEFILGKPSVALTPPTKSTNNSNLNTSSKSKQTKSQPVATKYVNGAPVPDWSQITLKNMKFGESGSVEFPNIKNPGMKELRTWTAGQSLSEVMECTNPHPKLTHTNMNNYLFATAKTITVREAKADTKSNHYDFSKYTDKLMSPQGLALAGGIGLILLLQLFSHGKKGKLATSYWGGGKETAQAKKKAKKQIASPKCDSASLYIGVHRYKGQKPPKGSGGVPLYVPDVQRGTAVIGAPGSGKSFSAINPMLYSAIDQGFGVVLYDFKYPSQAKIASYCTFAHF